MNRSRKLTLVVLLHIEPAQQHDRLLAEQASVNRVRWVDALVHVHRHDTTSTAKAVIEAAKVDAADSELAQSRSAHDAGLDGYVEVGGVQDGRVVARHDLAESDEFGVASALFFCSISVDFLGDWEKLKGEEDMFFPILTFKLAFVPLMPLPITSPSLTKTQPTGVSSLRRASCAISMALRMKPSWYSRSGIGPKTISLVLRSRERLV